MGKPTFTPSFLSPSALKRPQVSQALFVLFSITLFCLLKFLTLGLSLKQWLFLL